jgi:hypothetical protein
MSEEQVRPLSDRQQTFLQISACKPDDDPSPVRIMSASDWRIARSLVAVDLGRIEHVVGERGRFIAITPELAYPILPST